MILSALDDVRPTFSGGIYSLNVRTILSMGSSFSLSQFSLLMRPPYFFASNSADSTIVLSLRSSPIILSFPGVELSDKFGDRVRWYGRGGRTCDVQLAWVAGTDVDGQLDVAVSSHSCSACLSALVPVSWVLRHLSRLLL